MAEFHYIKNIFYKCSPTARTIESGLGRSALNNPQLYNQQTDLKRYKKLIYKHSSS